MTDLEQEFDEEEYSDDDGCYQCGGDGYIMLSEAGPSEWGEDLFCDEDRAIECPNCAIVSAVAQMKAKP